MTTQNSKEDELIKAARTAVERDELAKKDPEPSLGRRFGQIGILGWMIVFPVLAGIVIGGFLDRFFHGGITFSAALTMAGAALGLWLAFRWMHDQ
jgi:ATP synthase protein I